MAAYENYTVTAEAKVQVRDEDGALVANFTVYASSIARTKEDTVPLEKSINEAVQKLVSDTVAYASAIAKVEKEKGY